MKHKKGFALAATMVAMVVVLALSNLLLVLATTTNLFAKNQARLFENNAEIYQISQNFADFDITDFKTLYAEYEEEILNEEITVLYDNNYAFCLIITASDPLETLQIKSYNQTKTLAVIEKNSGQITVWEITN